MPGYTVTIQSLAISSGSADVGGGIAHASRRRLVRRQTPRPTPR